MTELLEKPLVSVALASYNGEAFLEQQLDSIFTQDYDNFEIVVSDDASSDQTKAILTSSRYRDMARQRGVEYRVCCHDDNVGYVKNFQRAVEQCRGQYIAFCDQDDLWREDKLRLQVEQLVVTGNLANFSDALLIDADGASLDLNLIPSVVTRPLPGKIGHKAFYLSNCVTGCTMIIDRRLMETALPFAPLVPHDWWLAYHAAYRDGLCFYDDTLVSYRQHSSNVYGLGSVVRRKRVKLYLRHKLAKSNISFQLVKYSRGLVSIFNRLQSFYQFESTTAKGPSAELEYLQAWISDKLANAELNQYREFFKSDSEVFQLFDPSRAMLDRYESGVRKIVKRVIVNTIVLVTVIATIILLAIYLTGIIENLG